MKINKKLHSVAIASVALILFLIFVSSAASAATEQSASSAGTYAYITNAGETNVSVIDTATNNVIATIDVEDKPFGIAVSPDGKRVYVTCYLGVSVIDTATNTVTDKVYVGNHHLGVVVTPDGKKVYMVNPDNDTISVIDTATNNVTATVNVGDWPFEVAVTPDGTKVYATNQDNISVSVIDTATNKVTSTVNVRPGPEGVAVNPNGKQVYVANNWDNTVSVIDTTTNKVTATVNVGDSPEGVAVTPDGTRVYVTNNWDNTVSVIDTKTDTVIASVPVGSIPAGVAVNPLGTKVYVTNEYDVSVIDTATNTVTATVAVGKYPVRVAVISTLNQVIPVANFTSNVTSGKVPLNVSFTDTSKGTLTSWKWNFGDGVNSTKQNPVHKYSKVGNYTVSLTATNDKGSSTVTKKDYIKVVTKPVANFTSNVTSGKVPLNVAFTDKSTGIPTKWKWTFGDGMNSTQQNPVHKYSKAGNYTVALTATNAAGSNTVTKTGYIKVVTKPVANFTSNVTSGKVPLNVAFTDKSTGIPTKWKWTFGDGINSTQQNPVHKYSKAGNYTVVLTVSNVAGSSTANKTNYITVTTST